VSHARSWSPNGGQRPCTRHSRRCATRATSAACRAYDWEYRRRSACRRVPSVVRRRHRATGHGDQSRPPGRPRPRCCCSPPVQPARRRHHPAQVREIGRWPTRNGVGSSPTRSTEHLVYGDAVFSPSRWRCRAMADRCVVRPGGEPYAHDGWRVGVIGLRGRRSARVTPAVAGPNVSNVAQRAALAAVSGDLPPAPEMRAPSDAGHDDGADGCGDPRR